MQHTGRAPSMGCVAAMHLPCVLLHMCLQIETIGRQLGRYLCQPRRGWLVDWSLLLLFVSWNCFVPRAKKT